ncbi:capsid protein VP2 [Sulfuracidifex metallicus]|uniref:capsid protein VP2 n=1 Tax=Sulfuracidifex metallicus TaxID=47303 RepID=UPI002276B78C|nr:capsid protein VP2 [Sulfuracidifex metallicus]MCY0851038.1 capsid protein VP2 [Sulfuracidifex metallicus]
MAHKRDYSIKNWLQGAIKRKGRVRKYLEKEYGSKAFTEKGDIKISYLNKALKKAKREGDESLERAIILAKRLKKMRGK